MATKRGNKVASDGISDEVALARTQYIRLANEIAARTGGMKRGWQRRVAMALDVSPGFLSKVLRDGQPVGDESMRRTERLGVPAEYFRDSSIAPGDHLNRMALFKEGSVAVPTDEVPRPSLLAAHRDALALILRVSQDGASGANNIAEIIDSVPFVREMKKATTPAARQALLLTFLWDVGQALQWAQQNPKEPTIFQLPSGTTPRR